MSCDHCPHCQAEAEKGGPKKGGPKFGVVKGGLSLPGLSDLSSPERETTKKDQETPFLPTRGRAREYTQSFEFAWKAYGRKEQKFEAFAVWVVRSREAGGEAQLLAMVLSALKWQAPLFAADGWKFAPYFERYLKRRKWEDERPSAAVVAKREEPRDGRKPAPVYGPINMKV
jgi:hypothetical protein